VGVYYETGDDRHVSVREASSPRWGGSVYDLSGFAHRLLVVILVYHGHPMGVGDGILVHSRGERITGEVWRGIQSISSARADAVGGSKVCGQSTVAAPLSIGELEPGSREGYISAQVQWRIGLRPNHSLERTRPARRDNLKEPWPGRSARNR